MITRRLTPEQADKMIKEANREIRADKAWLERTLKNANKAKEAE